LSEVTATTSDQNGSMKVADVEPMKLHRRCTVLDGRVCTVMTLRPSSEVRYATNSFHETWHVLSDPAGARLLGRLCWWLAFQRHPGTIVVIDRRFLVPTPFDADPSSPIVVSNADLTPVNRSAIRDLKRFLGRLGPSDGTVRVTTVGLHRLLAGETNDVRDELRDLHERSGVWWNDHQRRNWADRINGVVVLAAAPPVLQWWAVALSRLGANWYGGSDYTELDHPAIRRLGGEVQVFERFAEMVARAVAVRERVVPGSASRELLDNERRAVWAELSINGGT
jgi:hypothetical protein